MKLANESSNVAETARALGVKENTLYNWVYQHSHPSKPDKPVRTDEHLYDELKRLKKENAHLTEERDLLKKAAAYFARAAWFRPHGFWNRVRTMESGGCVRCCRSAVARTMRGQNQNGHHEGIHPKPCSLWNAPS
ncbi:MAG: transposase [Methylococcaceae bacterium]|nr:transposase [Methylococcaceae bacterium]